MSSQQIDLFQSLLTESLIHWHIGDWEYLIGIDSEDIAQHSEKCLIASFKAAALFQQGALNDARVWVSKALDWGIEPNVLVRTLLSGAHNSLGRAYFLTDSEPQAQIHIKEAMHIGSIDLDSSLLYPARFMQQKNQVISKRLNSFSEVKKSSKLTKEQLQVRQQQIKEKLEKAQKARTEKKYQLAEQLLSEILEINPVHLLAIKESAILHANQQQWMKSITEYDRLIKIQTETENSIRARSLMKKNANLLQEAIAELEHAKALGFYNSKIAQQLAVAYRDNQQWNEAENEIRELCISDPIYLQNLPFATFFADVLRKREKVKEAYGLLKIVVKQAQEEGQEIPLNTQAILDELQRTVSLPEHVREVSRYYYDAIYAQSEKYHIDSTHSVYLPVWEKVINLLKNEKVQCVLDIGCGPGQFAEYMAKETPKINYQGVDYSQIAIETARLRCPSAIFHIKDLMQEEKINFEADTFIILEVLEHIEKDIELLSKIPKKQKIIFSVPNRDSFGHVRFFKSAEDVIERYNKYFHRLNIQKVDLSANSCIFLGMGTIN